MKKSLFITALASALLLQGCQLTEFAADYFNRSVQLNNYEQALDVDDILCDRNVLSHLRKTRGDAWYDATLAYCKQREENEVPLVK